ncbi:hypothetical protein B484DRAFT_457215 [Ochromonadaceae sp. CCMP2298]|nr:hypothetical protein B484DRAFT_457215 [Ochromonadaceae sp. CCMP2298]|mmetsp:Transcript_11293/g.25119  ORF Transcript_11293/g.25119 Transcript_11293/m.25119 type:complete len:254 (+) Transcript_11293:195-956(+)
MRRFSLPARLALLTTAAVAHAVGIEAFKRTRKYQADFQLGSADDLIGESLGSGDIILFSRPWYKYHLPVGLMVASYKALFGSDFDHGGVVVVNDVGVPYVLEKTPFGGVKYRPFEDRILQSESAHIIVIPFEPPRELTAAQRAALKQHVASIVKGGSSEQNSELSSFLSTLYYYTKHEVLRISHRSQDAPLPVYCSSSRLIVQTLQSIDMEIAAEPYEVKRLTLRSIHDRSVRVRTASGKSRLAKSDVLVRSS